mmetsp:Transcript_36884/g.118285  ORF Transcript_36884/g.118285 Transcript_36884/m.118285 type:complete len:204 (-) Transcript_36884:47-658(-)
MSEWTAAERRMRREKSATPIESKRHLSEVHRTVALRGAPVSSASSPKQPPASRLLRTTPLDSTVMCPSSMMKKRSPTSPSTKAVSPWRRVERCMLETIWMKPSACRAVASALAIASVFPHGRAAPPPVLCCTNPASKSSRERRRTSTGSRQRMVACRGACESSAVSPKYSPAKSVSTVLPLLPPPPPPSSSCLMTSMEPDSRR